MTTSNINRRTALLGTAAALAPAAAMAQSVSMPNATDAAWAELQAAEAAFHAAYEKWEAFDDWIRGQIGNEPVPFLDTDPREYHRQHRAWREARAELPENPHEHPAGGEPRERLDAARDALVAAPVATMTDLERKLSVAWHADDHPEYAETILAGVRAMVGRVA